MARKRSYLAKSNKNKLGEVFLHNYSAKIEKERKERERERKKGEKERERERKKREKEREREAKKTTLKTRAKKEDPQSVAIQENLEPSKEERLVEDKESKPTKEIFPFVDKWFARIPGGFHFSLALLGGIGGIVHAYSIGIPVNKSLWYAVGGAIGGFIFFPALKAVFKISLMAGIIFGIGIAVYLAIQIVGSIK